MISVLIHPSSIKYAFLSNCMCQKTTSYSRLLSIRLFARLNWRPLEKLWFRTYRLITQSFVHASLISYYARVYIVVMFIYFKSTIIQKSHVAYMWEQYLYISKNNSYNWFKVKIRNNNKYNIKINIFYIIKLRKSMVYKIKFNNLINSLSNDKQTCK